MLLWKPQTPSATDVAIVWSFSLVKSSIYVDPLHRVPDNCFLITGTEVELFLAGKVYSQISAKLLQSENVTLLRGRIKRYLSGGGDKFLYIHYCYWARKSGNCYSSQFIYQRLAFFWHSISVQSQVRLKNRSALRDRQQNDRVCSWQSSSW